MTTPTRLRRHTDGRVALEHKPGWWIVVAPDFVRDVSLDCVTEPGWSELLTAELPEPDNATPATWTLSNGDSVTANCYGVDIEGFSFPGVRLHELRADALKLLAAVAASEHHQAQREATP